MKIEFGHVQKYNTDRGFGFVTRTFNDSDRRSNKNVWFHITKIKHNYPELAKQLDSGSYTDVCFWYEIDSSEREKVDKIWLDVNDIPNHIRDDLIAYIEQLWHSIDKSSPQWLEQVTLALVGESRKNELNQIRSDQICQQKEAEDLRRTQREARQEVQREGITSHNREPKHVYIGLPEHLVEDVLWVAREYRTNPLSHIPGGNDIVVEYHDGRVFGYDWIKNPSAYISTFFAGIVEYASNVFKRLDEQSQIEITKRKIAKVFARKYKDESEYSTVSFTEVWNSKSSNEMPANALKRFERQQQEQYDIEDEYDFYRPLSAFEYYGYEPCYEDLTEKAERLWGIPDPRLVED